MTGPGSDALREALKERERTELWEMNQAKINGRHQDAHKHSYAVALVRDLAALSASEGVDATVLDIPRTAAGWKLVPVEPTEAMVEAGLIDGSDDPDHEASDFGHPWVRAAIYRAMVKAAPDRAMREDAQGTEGSR